MSQDSPVHPAPVPPAVRGLNIAAKAALLVLLATALALPDLGHMQDKAAELRAVAYPLLSFAIPLIWLVWWRDRVPFPWLADLLVTLTCFSDILGNRINLYDTVVWFDDWMHFMNTGLLAAAAIVLTLPRYSSFLAILERAFAVGATAAIAWEIAEYFAFISTSSERRGAYTDTLSDLGLGVLGAFVAAVVIHRLWRTRHRQVVGPLPATVDSPRPTTPA